VNEFRFEYPLALLLLVLPIAIGLWTWRRQRRTAAIFSSVRLLDGLPVTARLLLRRLLPGVRVLGLLLLVVALARPQMGLRQFRVRSEGIAIAMCLDRSGSMQALDFSEGNQLVNRLQAVKRVMRDFVLGAGSLEGRPDDQISLIAFGGYAEDKTPLTLDHDSLVEQLDAVEIPQPVLDDQGRLLNERLLQEEMATAIGDAVALAVDRLKQVEAKSKVVILLSDGENTAGVVTPEEAARTARQFGVKIYSIGVGSSGLAPFPTTDRFGRQAITRQRVRLDEATLKMMADTTGGRYFNARDSGALESVYAAIDQMEKTVSEGRVYTQYNDLYLRLLLPGLAMLLLDAVLRTSWLRTIP
jgi:Ca-activated chloride channel family protein